MSIITLKNGNQVSGADIRIVCANIHHDTGEVEVVLEVKQGGAFVDIKHELKSIWLDKEALLEIIDGQKKL